MRRAVISFFPLIVSGRFAWWDDFPMLITRKLQAHGIEHICFYKGYAEHTKYPPDRRPIVGPTALQHPRWIRRHVRPWLRAFDRVIFHTHFNPVNRIWTARRPGRGDRWIATEHQSWRNQPFSPIKRQLRRLGRCMGVCPELIIAVSRAQQRRMEALFGKEGVVRIPNGIELPKPSGGIEDRAGPIRRGAYLGRLHAPKGVWPLVKAYHLLRDQGVNAHLTLVGDGPEAEGLRAYLGQHRLEPVIELMGYHPEPYRLYPSFDFVIVPTLTNEAFGLVSLEARAHGRPVIYTPMGGVGDTQIDGRTGLRLPEVSATQIAGKVMELQSDPERYARMCRDCRMGLDLFSIDRMTDQYLEAYLDLFHTGGPRSRETSG